LEVDALGGAPGVFSARYAGEGAPDHALYEKVLREMADVPDSQRTARFHCVLALVDPSGVSEIMDGTVEGLIIHEPRGQNGFGYDPVFFYPPLNQTLAELSPEAKNGISHRGRALAALKTKLQSFPFLQR
jgi:XTP/dITP diphosphohydrolase